MKQLTLLLAGLLILSGCVTQPRGNDEQQEYPVIQTEQIAQRITLFSAGPAGKMPSGWAPMVIFKNKTKTNYRLVSHQETIVLHAHSAQASSGLMQQVNIDPELHPWLHWQWKIGHLSDQLVQAHDLMEDVPVRIILGFDGDKDTLPFSEQILFDTAKLVTGHDFPYATLMYEWHSKEAVETIKHSKRSSRIRKIVVQSGNEELGKWRGFARNIVEDFEKAYGEKPGKLIGVGVLTDSDYARETIEAWYGDLRLLPTKE